MSIILIIMIFSIVVITYIITTMIIKFKRFNYRVVFLRKQKDVNVFYTSIKLKNILNNHIKFEDKTFIINSDESCYISKSREFIYFVDYDTGSSFTFREIESINPETLDMLVSNNIVGEITKAISRDKFNWVNFLFGAITGAFIVMVIFLVIQGQEESDIYYSSNNPVDLLKNYLWWSKLA